MMTGKRKQLLAGSGFLLLLIFSSVKCYSQDFEFSLHADPLLSWMSSNNSSYDGEGVRPGVSLGLDMVRYFDDNYGFKAGIGFFTAGGRLSAADRHVMVFNNRTDTIAAGDEMIYNLRYLNIPAGLHLRTNQIGYVTVFTDVGIDLRFLLRSTVDIPANEVNNELASKETYGINMGWHIAAGIEYELGIKSSIITGLGFDQDFFDITKDLVNAQQPEDRSGLRFVRIKFGIKF